MYKFICICILLLGNESHKEECFSEGEDEEVVNTEERDTVHEGAKGRMRVLDKKKLRRIIGAFLSHTKEVCNIADYYWNIKSFCCKFSDEIAASFKSAA